MLQWAVALVPSGAWLPSGTAIALRKAAYKHAVLEGGAGETFTWTVIDCVDMRMCAKTKHGLIDGLRAG